MLDLCLVGTGGMLPLPSRFLTSLYIKCQGHALLIDCGEGTQIALRKAGCSFKSIDLICITHFHADHISGIAGLLLSMGNADRTEPVTIAGSKRPLPNFYPVSWSSHQNCPLKFMSEKQGILTRRFPWAQ